MALNSKEKFKLFSQATNVPAPPRWPDFPPELAKKFPELEKPIAAYTEKIREFFRAQEVSGT